MHLNKKKLILVFICTVLGIITAYQETVFIRSKEIKYVPVVVAKEDIPVNSILTKDKLELRNYPESIVNSEFVKNIDQVEGKHNLRDQKAGTPFFSSDVSERKAAVVDEGMVRVSFGTDLPEALAGAVLPGDLICLGYVSKDGSSSKLLFSKVQVVRLTDKNGYDLNSGIEKRKNEFDNKGIIPATVTVIVKPEEAVVLKQHEMLGKIYLMGY